MLLIGLVHFSDTHSKRRQTTSHEYLFLKYINYLLESGSHLISLKTEEVNIEDHVALGYISNF